MDEVRIPFKIHPRVFSALGKELVTDEIVAMIELVKNSYDAFADRVLVQIGFADTEKSFVSIIDNGLGMDRKTIEDVWLTIATPNKVDNPFSERDTKKRRVTGAKGLGRLSSAMLGGVFKMVTKSPGDVAWQLTVDWRSISDSSEISSCNAIIKQYDEPLPFGDTSEHGTAIFISELTSIWDNDKVSELKINLSRLVSPIKPNSDFEILFYSGTDTIPFDISGDKANKLKIVPDEFLLAPKYCIKGMVNESGSYTGKYEYRPIGEEHPTRSVVFNKEWKAIFNEISRADAKRGLSEASYECGSFEYEIRAWDISPDDLMDIIDHNENLGKQQIRKAIAAYKGISVYRDDILVIPKTDTARDWLKLDLRRVSRVGSRLSTNQLIGYVSITADYNRLIVDSSDREKLQRNNASLEFEAVLMSLIYELETQRDIDKLENSKDKEKPFKNLFESLKQEDFISEYSKMAESGMLAKELIPMVQERAIEIDNTVNELQRRLIYYSRLATIGSISSMLIHEIRNRTTSIGYFFKNVFDYLCPMPTNLEKSYTNGMSAVKQLEELSDRFLPLANRNYKSSNKSSILYERIEKCLEIMEKDISELHVKIIINVQKKIVVRIGPAELDSVLLNLISNAVYWLKDVPKDKRELYFTTTLDNKHSIVHVEISDTGKGIRDDFVERVFLPGVTAKTNGIGMGLTVVAELLSECNGKIHAVHPGYQGGATFIFDLPI